MCLEHVEPKNDVKKEEPEPVVSATPTPAPAPAPASTSTETPAVKKQESFIPIVPSKRPHKKSVVVPSPVPVPVPVPVSSPEPASLKDTASSLSASKELKEGDLFAAPPKIPSARPARQSSSGSVASTSSLLDIYGNESEENSMVAEDEDEDDGVNQVPVGLGSTDAGDQTALEDSVTDQSDVSGLENKTKSFTNQDVVEVRDVSAATPCRVLDELEDDDEDSPSDDKTNVGAEHKVEPVYWTR
ncbi:unnamed protein product [Ambrosiozyma monospora]|uniref:Unnamed protein product n=1 Tax=Ambrosiozyma monospora TaxID=43982 RepID=A0ACB5U281_AMBMO|nr:unnamed protein product [Ambrosiozyma monospora]